MNADPESIAVVSGYFNPLHIGHLALLHAAEKLGPYLIVIVNNDRQQIQKKGRIIQPENDRVAIVRELRCVDEVVLAPDSDSSVTEGLKIIREKYPRSAIHFCNGGDRSPSADAIPSNEAQYCATHAIEMVYGVGGSAKSDSSSRIIQAMTTPG